MKGFRLVRGVNFGGLAVLVWLLGFGTPERLLGQGSKAGAGNPTEPKVIGCFNYPEFCDRFQEEELPGSLKCDGTDTCTGKYGELIARAQDLISITRTLSLLLDAKLALGEDLVTAVDEAIRDFRGLGEVVRWTQDIDRLVRLLNRKQKCLSEIEIKPFKIVPARGDGC